MRNSRSIEVIPSTKPLGAEVRGLDLREMNTTDFEGIYRAWLDHQVLLFRNQQLSDDDLIVFSRRFGELDWAPIQETGRHLSCVARPSSSAVSKSAAKRRRFDCF